MGLRTPEQYKEAMKDGREVYYRGELVTDVTHPPDHQHSSQSCVYRLPNGRRPTLP